MALPCLFVDDNTVTADLYGLTAVTLLRRHELDNAMAVPLVLPVHKRRHPESGIDLAGKWPDWVIRSVFDGSEQGF
jgi:hypothetical protein